MEKIFAEGKWRKVCLSNGYYSFSSNGKSIRLHRYLYEQHHKCSILPGIHVHHKDENKLNNDISNLDLIPRAEHAYEHKFKGGSVHWRKDTKKWQALVKENNKRKNLGSFHTKLEAYQALYKYFPEYWSPYKQAENYVKNIYNWYTHE
jgi:hypothetical protein